jgi:hypothetical protein
MIKTKKCPRAVFYFTANPLIFKDLAPTSFRLMNNPG